MPLLLDYFALPKYGSKSRRKYTVRLLLMCLLGWGVSEVLLLLNYPFRNQSEPLRETKNSQPKGACKSCLVKLRPGVKMNSH